MTFPRDETTPWGSNGVRAYWEGEASSATNTKPLVASDTLRLRKLMALVPVTDELLADATALDNYISTKTGDSIRWKSNDALINGTGAGMPLGILNEAALVSVAKETSQTATTFNAANVAKMFARMPAESMSNAVWIINNDVFPQLIVMTIGDTPVWSPDITGLSPAGRLLGRPIILSQSCKTLGTKGDVLFVDWKKYLTITKSSGVEMASSMHLYFEAGLTAFRATFRVDGQPWLKASITPANGSNNLSPFVSLDTRA
jgi:HK97 family phage major capsid protein